METRCSSILDFTADVFFFFILAIFYASFLLG